MKGTRFALSVLALVGLAGCATIPSGPSVMVLPGPEKPFEVFQAEDASCRQWALQQIGGSPNDAVNRNAAVGAAIGTAVGAGLGAAVGSISGHAGSGAVIGAAGGLLGGAAVGYDQGAAYGWGAQRRYDIAYQQCMYAKGNQIPGVSSYRGARPAALPPPPPAAKTTPAPPPVAPPASGPGPYLPPPK